MVSENSKTSIAPAYRREGQYIYIGEYPQSIKAEDVTINEGFSYENGYFLGSDGFFYAKATATPYDEHTSFSTGEAIKTGSEYFFKVEPIRFQILSEQNGEAFLLCDSILTTHIFDGSSNCYASSEIRAWLNGEFYSTAFCEKEKEKILSTTVSNDTESTADSANPYACENTEDYVFLLSCAEIARASLGFTTDDKEEDKARQRKTSDYARATGAFTRPDPKYQGNGYWRLRSPGSWAEVATCGIGDGGAIYNIYTDDKSGGIVPALRLLLDQDDRAPLPSTFSFGEFTDLTPPAPQTKKPNRKLLGIIGAISLVALLLLLILPSVLRGKYKYVYFGEYPQSVKAEGVTVDEAVCDSRGYYLGSDGAYYAKVTAKPISSKYTFSDGTNIVSGETYYFKVEPIRWRILEKKNGTALLLCDSIIDCQRFDYNPNIYAVKNDYEESTIRAWLNGSFADIAFTEDQKSTILTSTVKLSQSTSLEDKLFLLSTKEARKSLYGFAVSARRDDKSRRLKLTDYARAIGGWMNTEEEHYGDGTWWLRTPRDLTESDADRVLGGSPTSSARVNEKDVGVVAAMWIDLKKMEEP